MTEKIRALVADDEAIARDGLCALLAADPDIEVVSACADGWQAVAAIRELRPDLVFLDVQMPGLDGFGVLRSIEHEFLPTIVFVTAYDRYALKAFDVHAVDYLLKPFEDDRFQLALGRAKERIRLEAASGEPAADMQSVELSARLARFLDATERGELGGGARARYPARVVVRSGGRIRFLRTTEIVWIEAADYYAKLHAGDKIHMLRESLSSLEARLDPSTFFRVHRSAIVNLDHVRELQPYASGEHVIVLDDGTRLRLANTRREALAERLGERL